MMKGISARLYRFKTIFFKEFRYNLKRPLFWFLMACIVLFAVMTTMDTFRFPSGDSDIGGEKAWITSEFANGLILSRLVFSVYILFIAAGVGMTVIRDDESKVTELLRSTPLRPGEYIWAKFLGSLGPFYVLLAVHVLLLIVLNHSIPHTAASEYKGPFALRNYLMPAAHLCGPVIFFIGGLAFWQGVRFRKPILVYFVPVSLFIICLFFLWRWSPSWLDIRINRLLMILDPSANRWLRETWIKVDRGVHYYNTQTIKMDWVYLINRVWIILAGVAAVLSAHRFFVTRSRRPGTVRSRGAEAAGSAGTAALPAVLHGLFSKPIQPLPVSAQSVPGFFSTILETARAEFRELRSSNGLYVFILLVTGMTIGINSVAVDGAGSRMLITSGMFAMNTLRFLSPMTILLLLFYVVETAHRERAVNLDAIYFSLPVRNSAILIGKLTAVLMICLIIIATVMAGGILIISLQNGVGVQFMPFLIVWGGLLLPTCIVWCVFVLAVYALSGKRFITYGICLAVASINDYLDESGKMSWVWNWPILTDLRWSDMGLFELDRTALLLNRIMTLGLAVFFLAVASLLLQRRTPDRRFGFVRFQSRQTRVKFALLIPLLLIPISSGALLINKTRNGFEGSVIEKQAKDYWRHNLATYKDAILPDLDHVELDLEIDPADRYLFVKGSYSLSSRSDEPLSRIPLTSGFHWKNVIWTLNGRAYEPENRSGLVVFTLDPPLSPDNPCQIGFQFDGVFPEGISKNGRGVSEYILPSGAVLTSFSPSFSPVIGFMEGIGIDEDNQYQSKDYPDDFFTGVTEPLFGKRHPFTTDIQVTVPEEFIVNSTGTLQKKNTGNGSTTFFWVSDYPVRFFNVIAGKWDQRQGKGTRLFYHPEHTYNVEEILSAMDAAREYYSKWFMAYPWQELRISEFSGVSVYAQGFPTNISFSEGIGFLTKDNIRTNPAFTVTAHESAHQWWGNLVTPGEGPGGNIISEGMADFSTVLLTRQIKGDRARMEFCKRGEEAYTNRRQTDAERSMVKTDGSRPGDTVVTYDKGCWVFWMLYNLMGEESALTGMQTFIERYKNGPDYPVLQDFQVVMREFAPDTDAYDRFIQQWFYEVVIPEYVIHDAAVDTLSQQDVNTGEGRSAQTYMVTVTVENTGTGSMPVCIAAARNPRYDGDEPQQRNDYRDARTVIDLEPGKQKTVRIRCPFEPDRVVIDPDVKVLQMHRQLAQHHF